MQRILIWFQGNASSFFANALDNLLEHNQDYNIIGITGGGGDIGKFYINKKLMPFIPLDQVTPELADYIIVSEVKTPFVNVMKIFLSKGFSEECVINDRTICVPNFSFSKYRTIKKSKLSIISMNCAGGIISHLFSLPFRSPFVNMFMNEEDFLSLLEKDPQNSLFGELKLNDTGYETNLHIDYPIYELNGLLLNMNHYPDFYDAKCKWYERVQRINWYNLVLMMYTDNKETLERFDELPFSKKVCFVPFESDLPSAFSFDKIKLNIDYPTWDIANRVAGGFIKVYDLWDMLLYGKKTKLE